MRLTYLSRTCRRFFRRGHQGLKSALGGRPRPVHDGLLDRKVSFIYFRPMPRAKDESRYHHGDLERALVVIGIQLLEEGGVDALNVAEAARRLGVSSAAPYKHFRDRKALLVAIAAEGNRRLSQSLVAAVGNENDPAVAFALSGVAYVRWAAENPALYRVTLDPAYTAFAAPGSSDLKPPKGLESMATFWTDLVERVRSDEPLASTEPVVRELAGRALAHGLASLFAQGVFASIGIDDSQATRLARAVTGLPSEQKARPRRRKMDETLSERPSRRSAAKKPASKPRR